MQHCKHMLNLSGHENRQKFRTCVRYTHATCWAEGPSCLLAAAGEPRLCAALLKQLWTLFAVPFLLRPLHALTADAAAMPHHAPSGGLALLVSPPRRASLHPSASFKEPVYPCQQAEHADLAATCSEPQCCMKARGCCDQVEG